MIETMFYGRHGRLFMPATHVLSVTDDGNSQDTFWFHSYAIQSPKTRTTFCYRLLTSQAVRRSWREIFFYHERQSRKGPLSMHRMYGDLLRILYSSCPSYTMMCTTRLKSTDETTEKRRRLIWRSRQPSVQINPKGCGRTLLCRTAVALAPLWQVPTDSRW